MTCALPSGIVNRIGDFRREALGDRTMTTVELTLIDRYAAGPLTLRQRSPDCRAISS